MLVCVLAVSCVLPPRQKWVSPLMAFIVMAGAFTVTEILLVSVAVQLTLLALTVAVAVTMYVVFCVGDTVMLLPVSWLLQA